MYVRSYVDDSDWPKYYRVDVWDGELRICEFPVVRETQLSAFLGQGIMKPKRVNKGARASWAYPTKKLALESFLIRRKKYVQRLKDSILISETAIFNAKAELEKEVSQ